MKKILAVITSAVMMMGSGYAAPALSSISSMITANAADIVEKGWCGAAVTYTLDSEGTLTISGTGDMYDYDDEDGYSSPFSDKLKDRDLILRHIVIEEGVTSIGEAAFFSCDNLTTVEMADSVRIMGEYAFGQCQQLESIELSKNIKAIRKCAFYSCFNLKSIKIPDGVTCIGEQAFGLCRDLSSLQIPDSITVIEENAFHCCVSLKSFIIPNKITVIEKGVFWACSSLTTIEIPYNVKKIKDRAFWMCSGLESIIINNPECDIYNTEDTIWDDYEIAGVIYGYENSTAQAYAEKFGYRFKSLGYYHNKFENDTDHDGLLDDWENDGYDYDNDGIIDIDFKSMGADPKVPDIFIEADWMELKNEFLCFVTQKNTAPSPEALKMVYESFKSHGINVHIDAGPDSIMNYETGEKWGKLSGASALPFQEIFTLGENFENWFEMAKNNFTVERRKVFRYCIFANKYDMGKGIDSSGVAYKNYFIIACDSVDYNYNAAFAGTIMHELGHTLGLQHGGLYRDKSTGEVCGTLDNYKPNHLSVMNYAYQFSGLKTVSGESIIDFQNFKLPEIDENHINEADGIDPYRATEGTNLTIRIPIKKYVFFNDEIDSAIAGTPIDFNKNGRIDNDIKRDLNGDGVYGILTETLNEWENLDFSAVLIGDAGASVDSVAALDEMSVDEAFELGLLGDEGECHFKGIEAKTVFCNMDNQKLSVNIVNMYPQETNVKIEISSEIFDEDYSSEITVPQEGTMIEIPVDSSCSVGEYDITYTITLEDGTSETVNGIINVVNPEVFTMKIGESKDIPSDIIECICDNSSVAEVTDSQVIAKSEGTAYISFTTDDRDTYIAIVKVESADDDFLLGDVDGDGQITAMDASAVLTYYVMQPENIEDLGFSFDIKAADWDENGIINAIDASAILTYYVSH